MVSAENNNIKIIYFNDLIIVLTQYFSGSIQFNWTNLVAVKFFFPLIYFKILKIT